MKKRKRENENNILLKINILLNKLQFNFKILNRIFK